MAPGDVPDGERHRQDGETEREGHPEQADTDLGKRRREHGAAAATENEPEGAEELRSELVHSLLLVG